MRLIHYKPKKYSRNPRRSRGRSRRFRRNPAIGGQLRRVFAPSQFAQIGSVTVGFVAGAKGGGMLYDKVFSGAALSKVRRFAGLVTFGLGVFAASKVKNDLARKAAAGFSAAGIYDLIAQNLPAAGLKPVSGENIDMNGNIDLVGEGETDRMYAGDTIDVSGSMTELVGDDGEDRIYG